MEKLVIVIDAQNDFIYKALKNEEAIKKLPNLVENLKKAKDNKIPIWFTRDTHQIDYLDTNEGKHLPIEHCIYGSDGWKIVDELKDFAECIFDKSTFGSTRLAMEIARYSNLKQIFVMGFCTDICVISNVLLIKAFRPDIEITVLENCCAGVTVESHKAALQVMKSCQINVGDY